LRAWTVIRWTLSLALLAFVGWKVAQDWSKITSAGLHPRWGWIALACALLAGHVVVMIQMWRLSMRFLGQPVESRTATHILGVSNLAKYLPGGIWNLVGRAAMCQRLGIPAGVAVESMVVEVAVQLGANSLVAAVALAALGATGNGALPVWSPAIVLLPLVGLQPRLINGVASLIERATRRKVPRIRFRYRQILLIYAISIANWCLLGLAFAALGQGLTGTDLSLHDVVLLAGAANAAWLAGNLAFFVPGALGVREVALTVLLGTTLGAGWPAALAIASRLWVSAIELGWFGLASVRTPAQVPTQA
jgi:hypothetical protein